MAVSAGPIWTSIIGSITVVGTAANGRDAVEEARALKPDIILMDLWMPWLNGLEATRQICAFDPAAKILIITNDIGSSDRSGRAHRRRPRLHSQVDGRNRTAESYRGDHSG